MAEKDSKQNKNLTDPNETEHTMPDFSLEPEPEDNIRLSVKGAVREGSTPKFELNLNPSMHTAQFEKDTLLKEQLESVDFYIEQGFLEVAFTTLERLELFFPNHPLISERLDRMANMEMSGGNSSSDSATEQPVEINEPEVVPPQPIITTDYDFRVPTTAELPKVTEDSEIAIELPEINLEPIESPVQSIQTTIEPATIEPVEITPPVLSNNVETITEQAVESEPESKGLDNFMEQTGWEVTRKLPSIPAYLSEPEDLEPIDESLYQTVTDGVDVSEEMLQTVTDIAQPMAAIEPPAETATNIASPQNDLLNLFDEIGEGDVTVNETAEAEFTNHYNVGLSYYEIELYDDAVEEFQAAYRALQTTGNHPNAYQCCMMLGHCFRLKAMARPALIWYRRALEAPGHELSEYCDARYELACVHQDLGENAKALELFREIDNVLPEFRDVRDQIIALGG